MDKKLFILLVEDDRRLAELIREYLVQNDFKVKVVSRGDQAEKRILEDKPDLVILDLMLPGRDGFSVCQSVRGEYKGPILILTAREDDIDQVAGLEMGADDYVKKPIEPRVLLARIRAMFRRFHEPVMISGSEPMDCLEFGGLRLDCAARSAMLDGNPVTLTTNEFDLLWLLASRNGQVLDRDTILSSIRGIAYDGLDRSVDVRISRLRKKLGDDSSKPARIKTVWGRGYLFVKDAW